MAGRRNDPPSKIHDSKTTRARDHRSRLKPSTKILSSNDHQSLKVSWIWCGLNLEEHHPTVRAPRAPEPMGAPIPRGTTPPRIRNSPAATRAADQGTGKKIPIPILERIVFPLGTENILIVFQTRQKKILLRSNLLHHRPHHFVNQPAEKSASVRNHNLRPRQDHILHSRVKSIFTKTFRLTTSRQFFKILIRRISPLTAKSGGMTLSIPRFKHFLHKYFNPILQTHLSPPCLFCYCTLKPLLSLP